MSSIEICDAPVFVLGCPRSGTTALGKCLGAHPSFWASNETKFMSRLFSDETLEQVICDEVDRPTASWFRTNDVSSDEFVASIGNGLTSLITSRSSGRRWVDHTPHYTPIASRVARLFPGARFVLIVRDGCFVVESMLHFADRYPAGERQRISASLPEYTRNFEVACRTWVAMIDAGEVFATTHPGRCLVVRNEVISGDPARAFAEILDFLGADDDAAPAEQWQSRRFNSSFGQQHRQREVRAHPWLQWSGEQRATFTEIGGGTMAYGSASTRTPIRRPPRRVRLAQRTDDQVARPSHRRSNGSCGSFDELPELQLETITALRALERLGAIDLHGSNLPT